MAGLGPGFIYSVVYLFNGLLIFLLLFSLNISYVISVIVGAGYIAVKKTPVVPALKGPSLWCCGPSPGFMLESLGEL